MSKIIIANWKSHPSTISEAQELFKAEIEVAEKYPNVQTIIFPPEKFLEQLTGSALRTDYVLVGHSNQREAGETDELINEKIKKALEVEIAPILFIGEREGESREEILKTQLEKDLAGLSADQISKIIFAYEPVWAISRPSADIDPEALSPNSPRFFPQRQFGPDTPENALGAINFIKEFLKLSPLNFLYGGSINEKNVGDFLKYQEISGVVVGKASLDAVKFEKILEIANNIKHEFIK